MSLLDGKCGLVMGVANDKSISWHIAEAAHNHGAKLMFSYQGEVLLKRVQPLAQSIDQNNLVECDVVSDESLDNLFANVKKTFPNGLDFILHGIAFSDKDELRGKYYDTSRANFKNTMDISCYSLTAIVQAAKKHNVLNANGSVITLTYYGAEKVVPNYNVMGVAKAALEASVRYLAMDLGDEGIRINSISAGPVRTLAAMGIGGFRDILDYTEKNAPLKRNISGKDVAGLATFLISDLSSGVTGENIYVDAGMNCVGIPNLSEKIVE